MLNQRVGGVVNDLIIYLTLLFFLLANRQSDCTDVSSLLLGPNKDLAQMPGRRLRRLLDEQSWQ
jgi:hypothetical protein